MNELTLFGTLDLIRRLAGLMLTMAYARRVAIRYAADLKLARSQLHLS